MGLEKEGLVESIVTIDCMACHGHGKRWHTPYPSGWNYAYDFDPAKCWPGDNNEEWRKKFVSSLVLKDCQVCKGSGRIKLPVINKYNFTYEVDKVVPNGANEARSAARKYANKIKKDNSWKKVNIKLISSSSGRGGLDCYEFEIVRAS